MAGQNGKEGGGGGGGSGGGWFTDFARGKLRLFVAAGLGLAALNAGSTAAFGWWYRKSVLDTLMHGVLPPAVPPPELERPQLRQRVREMLQPQEASRFYHIVTGPPGGGKSTLLREACREMGSGVGYIEVSPAFDVDWGRDLGNAFNFRCSNLCWGPSTKTRAGRPFVLVIDSADRLSRSEESQKVLGAMLEYARDWAQEGSITTVFVAHDWNTVERLTGDHPAQSRAAPPLTVPDISEDEALQYMSTLGLQPKLAKKCAGLLGGSLLLMQRSAAMLKAGVPFAEVKQQLFDLIEIAYLRAGLLDAGPHQEGGLAAIEALLASKNGSISAAEWRGCVPERQRQRELLSKGVLRFDGHSVRFASNLAACYAAEQLRGKLPRSVADAHKGLRRPGWW
ncbi:hypothetical protein C2E21_7422 [Chlorella sorokiniana]|uniref:AAA+ ATPase domain-containing protein n=1 Tax=Chlorella sorokiniana TaxID=3076 RepID=A0A2P6TI26_CHLSO|nr:hypothetical protein C2E21_7422 [Chlorella sorokiniana]|eukprot:PRW33927.1 hypothetical protein C2E21_7422 [Chlorella sorokiniana]